jgi:hypothetical protein
MEFQLEKFGKNLNSRPLADNIFATLDQSASEITVDFEGVVSASPSFCHEMLIIIGKTKKPIKIINTNDNIKLQLNKAISSLGNN